MKKVGKNEITYQQFTYIIIGTIIGVGILALPGSLAEISKQDGWVSAIIGVWYPLYIVLLAIHISKNFPEDNIFSVSTTYFGKFIGGFLNTIFSAQLFIFLIFATSGVINLSRVFIVQFLTVSKLAVVLLALGVYTTFLGLKVIGRINEAVFYLLVLFLLFPLTALKDGSILNVSPFLGSGIKNILKASIESGFAYSGVEVILLIYPNVTDKSKIKGAALKSVLIITFIYAYITFITIYFVGPDIILKPYWPMLLLNETINLPFLSSFRFIFMSMWLIILFKTVINCYYNFTFSICNSFLKLNIQKLCFVIYPFVLYPVIKLDNEAVRRDLIGKTMKYIIIFNLLFVTTLAIFVNFKRGKKNENS